VGIALMAAFALIFAVVALRADPATPVLTLARPVAAGQTISEADLAVLRVVPGTGMQFVTEADRSSVVGRTATVPLLAGSLLSPAQVGTAAWPPAGESVIAVPVAAGRLPTGLSTGSRVSVLVSSSEAPTATGELAGTAVAASVVAVPPPTAAGVTTVSLLLPSAQARQVAGSGGEVVLVLESPLPSGTG
jgi:hypothetical protein